MVDDYNVFLKEVKEELFNKLNFSMLLVYTTNRRVNIKIYKNELIIIDKNYVNIFEALSNIVYIYNLKKSKQKITSPSTNYKNIFNGTHMETRYINKDAIKIATKIMDVIKELGRFNASNAQTLESLINKIKIKNNMTHSELKAIKDETSLLIGKELNGASISSEHISLEKYRTFIKEAFDDLY